MTDPRMTTPDAPVTVEQCDRDAVQAFHRKMLDRLMSDVKSQRPKLGGDEGDAGTLVQAFARHRLAALAALASAPAGDGVEEAIKMAIAEGIGEYVMPGAPYDAAVGNILAALASAPAPSWAETPEHIRDHLALLAEVELHLQSSRVFVTTREKMHPCGVDLHDELLGKVTTAIETIGKGQAHG